MIALVPPRSGLNINVWRPSSANARSKVRRAPRRSRYVRTASLAEPQLPVLVWTYGGKRSKQKKQLGARARDMTYTSRRAHSASARAAQPTGFFLHGRSEDPSFNPTNLMKARAGEFIFVSYNYRFGGARVRARTPC